MLQRLIFALLMSFILSLLMTAWVTWINLGGSSRFLLQWLQAFILAWPAAAVIAFVCGPEVQKLTLKILQRINKVSSRFDKA